MQVDDRNVMVEPAAEFPSYFGKGAGRAYERPALDQFVDMVNAP
jgi:hypothetical protein